MTRAIYIRTSTADQDGRAQRDALRTAKDGRGWGGDVLWFEDIGHSGAKSSRPEFDKMRAGIRSGQLREVMVYALDRLGRSLVDLLHFMQEVQSCGCSIVSLREGVDLSTPAGRLQMQLLGALAEFERGIIRERVVAGIAAARNRGVKLGRRATGPEVRERARRMRADGCSWGAIERALGVPRSTVRRLVAGVPKT